MNVIKVKQLIKKIGTAKIIFDKAQKDYLYNGTAPYDLPSDHFSVLFRDYKKYLFLQLKENSNDELIEKYVNQINTYLQDLKCEVDKYRVSYVFANSKKQLSEMAEETELSIKHICTIQEKVLRMMKAELLEIAEYKGYQIASDFELEIDYQNFDTIINTHNKSKATFNLSKKDIVLLFYTLEKTGLITFENDVQRNRFIESNFKYTELRGNDNFGNTYDLKGVNEEISKLKSSVSKQITANNKAKENLIETIYDQIHNFNFKS